MQCQRFLYTIFLSISIVTEFPLAPKAFAIAQDPEPVLSFEHQKGGYGDFLAAVFAARTDDSDVASHLYNNVLSLHPTNKDLQRITFYHGVLAGNDIATQLAKTQKGDPVANLVMTNDAILKGQWQDAYRNVSRPPMDILSQITYPLLQAWCLYGVGKTEQAISNLVKNSQGKPLSGLYALHAAIMYSLAKDDEKAGKMFEKADQAFSGADLLLTQTYGNWLANHHRMGKAEAMVSTLIKNLPFLQVSSQDLQNNLQKSPIQNAQQAIAQVYLAMASLLQQDLASQQNPNVDQTIANKAALHTEQIFLRFALQLNPQLSSARMMLSGILAQEKHFAAAKEVLLPIAEHDPLKTVIELRVARLNALLNHTQEAEKEIKLLLQQYPKSADIWQALGDMYFDQKQYKEAAETYGKVLEFAPLMDASIWPVLFARAVSYQKLNQWNKAEKDLRQALVFAPNEPMLLNYLGYSWVLKNINLKEAQAMLQKAVDISPDEGAIRDSLGWAMLMNGQLNDAIKELELAAETIPQDPELNYHLGVAYWKTGRHQEAINQWNVALTCSPDPEEKELILKALQEAKDNHDISVINIDQHK